MSQMVTKGQRITKALSSIGVGICDDKTTTTTTTLYNNDIIYTYTIMYVAY